MTDPRVSRCMRANKSKDTGPELRLRAAVRSMIGNYYTLYPKLPGKPDMYFKRFKLAVFVNGCFWHRCPKCKPKLPKTNRDFWRKKFKRNVERDAENESSLKSMGVRVITVWECEIERDVRAVARRVKKATSFGCRWCGRQFHPTRTGRYKFCSKSCSGKCKSTQGWKTMDFLCHECGASFRKRVWEFNFSKNKSGAPLLPRWCSKRCEWRSAERKEYWRCRLGLKRPTKSYLKRLSSRKRKIPGRCRDCGAEMDFDGYLCATCLEKKRDYRLMAGHR